MKGIAMNHLSHDNISLLQPSEGSVWNIDTLSRKIAVRALPYSDIFIDPGRGTSQVTSASRCNAATLLRPAPGGDFQFCSTVKVEFGNTFDAGVLLLYVNERSWAKLCFEYSPEREPMVVSVVNNGYTSDDANAFTVSGQEVHLRISRKDNVFAFHASLDGQKWIFVRAFPLDVLNDAEQILHIGFEAQAPNASGCEVEFSDFALVSGNVPDFRSGK